MFKATCARLALSAFAIVFAGWASAAAVLPPDDDEADLVPTGKGWGERPQKPVAPDVGAQSPGAANPGGEINQPPKKGAGRAGAKTKNNNITLHGGPVMLGQTNVYYIWYGNWAGNSATTILADFANNVGGSPYFNINTSYYNSAGTHVSNAVKLMAAATDNYSKGKALTDANIQGVVSGAITSGALPKDTNGVYFVLTSADVNATSGFCTQYCGWHTYGSISGSSIKFAFVGNPDRCPSACAAQTIGPNGNAGADGMASIIAHELEETVTDPNLNAWYDRSGQENADKCAWTFGTGYTVGDGALANMKLGARDYLIQRNWDAALQACALAR